MKFALSCAVAINFSHTHPTCGPRLHGHSATIDVEVGGSPAKERGSFVTDPREFVDTVKLICGEVTYRPLEEMISPASPTIAGLAGWLFDRLVAVYPALTRVSVVVEDMEATVMAE